MNSIRKWFYRPRRDDTSLLAQFYYADEELNLIAGELDNFDGRKDQERCTALVNQLRHAQDKVLNICVEMMEDLLPDERAPRDFRVKFPDDVMQETLSGQLWFGAECLAAGSNILNRVTESTRMRPLAKAVTKTIENVRNLLREQCLKPIPEYTEKIRESLKIFDRLFADFELSYVSAMVPVKTVEEYEMQQNVAVLFSDTLQRALKLNLVTQEQVDNYDPALMFTIPRLAIIAGLVIFPDGPLNLEKDSKNLSELFRSFKTLLFKIRELLWTLSPQELATLEKCLCSMEEPDISLQTIQNEQVPTSAYPGPVAYTSDFVHKFYSNYPSCRQLTPEMISLCSSVKKIDKLERKRDRNSGKSSRSRAKQERQSERFLSRLTGVEERPRARRRTRRNTGQHPHYYQYPEHYDELVPPPHPYSGREVTPQYSSNRHSHHSRTSTHKSSQNRSSNSDRRHTHYSGRHCRTRPACPVSRHRPSRINTIVCACGSTNSSVTNNVERYNRYSTDDEFHLDQHTVYTVNDPNITQTSNDCPYFRHSNPEETEYNVPSSHPYSFQDYDYNNQQYSISTEESARPVNIQNCVANAVISDPCILSPISMYEINSSESNFSPSAQAEINSISSGVNNLNLIDETINSEQNFCDDCNNIQSYCCDTNNCDNQNDRHDETTYDIHQKANNSDENSHTNSTSKNCNEVGNSNISIPTTSDDTLCNPIPEPRDSVSNFKSYNPKGSCQYVCPDELVDERSITEPKMEVESRVEMSSKLSEDCDNDSGSTSSHHSGTEDDEEVALALQAAEVAVSWKARERFTDSSDLIQRLFVCISGVADQLQTNYASDLRKILRFVFLMNQTPEDDDTEVVEILEGKEHIFSRDTVNEDVTSTNGSEQLSVESAEDALVVIGSPERETLAHSPDEVSDMEIDNTVSYTHSNINEAGPRAIHTSSVVVPASVFNDHSLMQYSEMSPPPISNLENFEALNENHERSWDNDSPSNEVSISSEVTSPYPHHLDSSIMDNLVLNLGTISESINLVSTSEPLNTLVHINNLDQVASSSQPHHPPNIESPSSASTQSPVPPLDPPESITRRYSIVQEPPSWIPDHLAPRCMACGALFTVVRRRHHCRNCGKVFCGHCSRHSVPLPHFGIWKNVRVCNACFLYYVTSTADGSSALS